MPPLLYKYLPPERLDVLRDCRVRFSQRSVFDDDHELTPDVAKFGTLDEIWRFVLRKGIKLPPGLPLNVLVMLIAESPKAQASASQVTAKNIKSLDQIGIFCLTESKDSERMWAEYAGAGRGFVVGFHTAHAGFGQLSSPGKLGKVSYSDEPFGTYLGILETEGVAPLFRKRMKYAFELEWRSIRTLQRLEARGGNIFLSPFDPASVSEVVIRPESTVETDLRRLVSTDARYHHVKINTRNARPE
jgi:hypothetical protein